MSRNRYIKGETTVRILGCTSTRLSVLLDLQRIERDDLPADLQSIYDATCSCVG